MLSFKLLLACAMFMAATNGGCANSDMPPLLEVTGIGPASVDTNEKVEIIGAGFPSGRLARVTLTGTTYRPYEEPTTEARIVLSGTATSATRIEVVFDEANTRAFGAEARHVNFEGGAQVSFAGHAPGAPPVYGVLNDVKLDVRPGTPPVESEERSSRELLASLGVESARPTGNGILLEKVVRGSRAYIVGFDEGDTLSVFDHKRILTMSDVSVSTQDGRVSVRGRKPDGREVISSIEVSKQFLPISNWGSMFGWALLLGSVLVAVWRNVLPVRAMYLAKVARSGDWTSRTTWGGLVWFLCCAVSAAILWMRPKWAQELDLIVLAAVALSVSVYQSAVFGKGFRIGAAQVFLLGLALFGGWISLGSIHAGDAVSQQGVSPLGWLVFRNPCSPMAFLVYALATSRRTTARFGWTEVPAALLGAIVFLGGWAVPPAMEDSRAGIVMGAAMLGGKVILVVIAQRIADMLVFEWFVNNTSRVILFAAIGIAALVAVEYANVSPAVGKLLTHVSMALMLVLAMPFFRELVQPSAPADATV